MSSLLMATVLNDTKMNERPLPPFHPPLAPSFHTSSLVPSAFTSKDFTQQNFMGSGASKRKQHQRSAVTLSSAVTYQGRNEPQVVQPKSHYYYNNNANNNNSFTNPVDPNQANDLPLDQGLDAKISWTDMFDMEMREAALYTCQQAYNSYNVDEDR